VGADAGDVLDLLSTLVDKSLVVADSGTGGVERYRLLETLRQYAWERLVAAGEAASIQRRRADYYLKLVEPLADSLLGERDLVRSPVAQERENLRAALRWFSEERLWDECLRLISALAEYWFFSGNLAESAPWLRLGMEHSREVSLAARGLILLQLGRLAFFHGDQPTAREALTESIRIFQERGYRVGEAWARIELGSPLRELGEYAAALATISEGLEISRQDGVPRLTVSALFQLAGLAHRQGELARSAALLDEMEQTMRGIGSFAGFDSAMYSNMGLVAADQGEVRHAFDCYTRSMEISRATGFRSPLLSSLGGLGILAVQLGWPEKTLVLLGAAATARDRGAFPPWRWNQEQVDQACASARAELGPLADAHWARGQAMTLEQAISYALGDDSSEG
jgi:non-specific serine/threonine protein kinase